MEALFMSLNEIYPMSVQLQNYIHKNLKRRTLKKREFLIKEHQVNSIGSFLSSGLLHCYYKDNGEKITSWFLQEGEMAISVQSFFSQTPSTEYIQALEPCELFYLTYDELEIAYKKYLEFNYIIRVLVQKYYVRKEKHAYQLQRKTTIIERFEWFMTTFPDLLAKIPMRHVASFLGVTEETLSRIRRRKKP